MRSMMRTTVLVLLALILSGCGSYRTDRESEIKPMVIALPKAVVFQLCLDSAREYFCRVDKSDIDQGYLYINNNNFWAGDTDVNVFLQEQPEGIEVSLTSKGAGFNQPLYNRSENDAKGFFKVLSVRVWDYQDTHPKVTPEVQPEVHQ